MAEPAGAGWDSGTTPAHESTVATATAGPEGVVLNFGDAHLAEDGALVPVLQGRVGLSAQAAKHLHDMLSRLFAEHDATARRRT